MATDNNGFQIVGPKQISAPVLSEQTKRRLPSVSFAILGMIVLGCLLANVSRCDRHGDFDSSGDTVRVCQRTGL